MQNTDRSNQRPVDQIRNALNEITRKDDLLEVGRTWANRAKEQGVRSADAGPIFNDAFGGETTTSTR